MSLTDRLRRIEQRLAELESKVATGEQVQEAIVQALEEGAEAGEVPEGEPMITLDGEHAGAERDQSQSLDG